MANRGAIMAGIFAGILFVSILLGVLAYYVIRRRREKSRSRSSQTVRDNIADDENYSSILEAYEKNFDNESKAEEKEQLRRWSGETKSVKKNSSKKKSDRSSKSSYNQLSNENNGNEIRGKKKTQSDFDSKGAIMKPSFTYPTEK